MHETSTVLAYALICPVALLYLFFLNDQWRIALGGKILLLLFSGLFPLCLPPLLLDRGCSLAVFLVIPWLAIGPILWWASRLRGSRFLFILLTGILFTYLTNSVADKLAYDFHLPALLFRVVMDAGILLFVLRYFRPAFHAALHTAHRGWPLLCLIPLALWGTYLALLSYPNYFERAMLHQVQFFVIALLLLALLLYLVIFTLFKRLQAWHEDEVDTALLDTQLEDLDRRLRHQRAATERMRILRHDLRHYLPIFSQRLRAGDAAGAQEILDAMRARSGEDRGEGGAAP